MNIDQQIERLSSELQELKNNFPKAPKIDPRSVPPNEAVKITNEWNQRTIEWKSSFDSKMKEMKILLEKVREVDG